MSKKQTTPAHPKGGRPKLGPKYGLIFRLKLEGKTLYTFQRWDDFGDKQMAYDQQQFYLAKWKSGYFTLDVELVGVNVPASEAK